MKILMLNTMYYPNRIGGAEVSTQLLVEKLNEKGHEVVVITTSNEDKIEYINGVKCYYLHHRNLFWGIKESSDKSVLHKSIWHLIDNFNFKMKKKIEAIINIEKPEIIHTNNLTGLTLSIWSMAKKISVPTVHTLRDYSLICAQGTMFDKESNCAKRCAKCSVFTEVKRIKSNLNSVSCVVGLSNSILNTHIKNRYFKDVKSETIYNGELFSNSSADESKKEEIVVSKRLRFLYIGRIEESKGIHQLLKVFSKLPQVDLAIAGRVDDKFKDSLELESNIKFLGYMNSDEAIEMADFVVVPSLWREPFGRVVIEAYKHNKPVIVSNTGGLKEIVVDNSTGFVIDPNDLIEFENIIKYIITNKENIIKKFRLNITEYKRNFDINFISDKYENLYSKLINEKLN